MVFFQVLTGPTPKAMRDPLPRLRVKRLSRCASSLAECERTTEQRKEKNNGHTGD